MVYVPVLQMTTEITKTEQEDKLIASDKKLAVGIWFIKWHC